MGIPIKDIQKIKFEVLAGFDFNKMVDAMEAMGMTWAGRLPTVGEAMAQADQMLTDALTDEKSLGSSTGGLYVSFHEGTVFLRFIPIGSEFEDEDDQYGIRERTEG